MSRISQAGFTLLELVAVIVVIGIVVAIAAPRFIGRAAFDEMGYYNSTLSTVRYAQKVAIAQRRSVCVVIAANQISLVYAAGGACGGAAVNAPGTSVPMVAVAPGGIGITAGNTFAYDSLGQPVTPAGAMAPTQVVTVGGRNFTVEAQTGYAHP